MILIHNEKLYKSQSDNGVKSLSFTASLLGQDIYGGCI